MDDQQKHDHATQTVLTDNKTIVVVPSHPVAVQSTHRYLKVTPGGVLTSLDFGTQSGKVSMVKAMTTEDLKAEEAIDEIIDVEHVLVHIVMLPDKVTGELKPCKRTVLVGTNGVRVAAVSDGVISSLDSFAGVFGPPPWNPPIKCRIKRKKSAGGNWFYILDPEE